MAKGMQARAVEAEEAANRLIAELSAPEAPATPETPPVDNVTPITPVVAPVATPDVVAPASNENVNQLSELQNQLAIANQRWNVLQGMINKKDSEIEQMRVIMAQISQPAAPAAKPTPTPSVTSTEIEEYGADLIDVIGRKANMAIAEALTPLLARITKLEESLMGVSQETARTASDTFEERLTRLVPDWETINVNPAFLEWLEGEEEFVGVKRMVLLQDAYNKMDAPRTAKFFTTFAKSVVLPVVAPAAPVVAVPSAEKHVAPSKRANGIPTTPDNQGKKIWTRADITNLYESLRERKITQAQFDESERDLFTAQREGRIAA